MEKRPVLHYYDYMITVHLCGDASSCGLGCFLSTFGGKIRTNVALMWVGHLFPIMHNMKQEGYNFLIKKFMQLYITGE